MKLKLPLILLSLATIDINVSISFAQSIEIYRKQIPSEAVTFSEYTFQNSENKIAIKADDEDYQNSSVQFNGKKYSLKQIYAPYHQDTKDSNYKYFANDVSHIQQVFLLNNQELVVVLSSSFTNFGMQFYPPFGLSIISIKDGSAQMKGSLKGLTLASQGFIITPQGLELVQFTGERDSEDNELSKPRRLSATYQNGKLNSKIVPYTIAYKKQAQPSICKLYLAHSANESRNDNPGSPLFIWDNTPDLTSQELDSLEQGSVNIKFILERKYCK